MTTRNGLWGQEVVAGAAAAAVEVPLKSSNPPARLTTAVTISQGTSLAAPSACLTPAGFPGGSGPMPLFCAMAADDRKSTATTNLAVFTIYKAFRSSLAE